MSRSARLFIICGFTLTAIVAIFFLRPVAQDPAYNNFADQRGWLGIPNFLNVISNAPFLFVGAVGLWTLFGARQDGARTGFVDPRERWAFGTMFFGVALTAIGSAYYHWNPTNQTLVWDRLPMTIGFMGLLSAVMTERLSLRVGFSSLWPLVVAGVASVAYWDWTEINARGDLRPYIVVQYLSLLILLLLIALFPPRYSRGQDFIIAVGLYGLAKVFEVADGPLFALGGFVSGHTLKHLSAALALGWLVRMLRLRRPVPPPEVA